MASFIRDKDPKEAGEATEKTDRVRDTEIKPAGDPVPKSVVAPVPELYTADKASEIAGCFIVYFTYVLNH